MGVSGAGRGDGAGGVVVAREGDGVSDRVEAELIITVAELCGDLPVSSWSRGEWQEAKARIHIALRHQRAEGRRDAAKVVKEFEVSEGTLAEGAGGEEFAKHIHAEAVMHSTGNAIREHADAIDREESKNEG